MVEEQRTMSLSGLGFGPGFLSTMEKEKVKQLARQAAAKQLAEAAAKREAEAAATTASIWQNKWVWVGGGLALVFLVLPMLKK